jgi:CheY-like chemotaxis protein/HEAT repeat protein
MEHGERAFLDELKYCIGKKDMLKAAAVLQFFPEISAKTQARVLYQILKAPDAIAFPLLEHLSRVPVNVPEIKDKIVELTYEKSYNNAARIVDFIRSKDTKNKAFYVGIAGNLKLRESIPALDEILLNAADERLLLEAITAVGKIGDPSSSSSIAPFLGSDSTKLKLAAINALADIGGASAIKKLCETLTGKSDTALTVIDTLARIQDHQSLEKLAELLSSRFTDLRNAAIDRLIAIGSKAIPFVVDCLKGNDDDTMIHSLNVLGNIGDLTALPAIVKVIYDEPKNSNVRFAVYEAMERLPSNKSAVSLAQGLTDPINNVSMAAAKAIDKNLSTILVAGLRNMIEAQDEHSMNVVATLLDSGADNVFGVLLDSTVFQAYAVTHLAERAHPDIVKHYLELLGKKGMQQLISQIQDKLKPEGAGAVRIMAVDDSKTMLKIYMRMLHDMGFVVDAQEFPAKALLAAQANKPDLVITDLNMPEMNGIRLSQELRKSYSSQQLPILMITTQSDIIGRVKSGKEGGSAVDIETAGIDLVLNKPFEATDLQNAINSLLKR